MITYSINTYHRIKKRRTNGKKDSIMRRVR